MERVIRAGRFCVFQSATTALVAAYAVLYHVGDGTALAVSVVIMLAPVASFWIWNYVKEKDETSEQNN